MERIYCTNCDTTIRTVRKKVTEKQKVIRNKCSCTEANYDQLPYEIEGWKWVEEKELKEDEWRQKQEEITKSVNESLCGKGDVGGRIT